MVLNILFKILGKIKFFCHQVEMKNEKSKLGYCGNRVKVEWPNKLNSSIFLYDDVCVYGGAKFIIGPGGKFIMKHHSFASQGLTVITGKHGKKVGRYFHDVMWYGESNEETTITVEEDVQIGANVTLLSGVTIGRGAQIGACSVVTKDIPPYAVAAGNPARVINFQFTPDEIIEHEKILFPENERLSFDYISAIKKYGAKKAKKHFINFQAVHDR